MQNSPHILYLKRTASSHQGMIGIACLLIVVLLALFRLLYHTPRDQGVALVVQPPAVAVITTNSDPLALTAQQQTLFAQHLRSLVLLEDFIQEPRREIDRVVQRVAYQLPSTPISVWAANGEIVIQQLSMQSDPLAADRVIITVDLVIRASAKEVMERDQLPFYILPLTVSNTRGQVGYHLSVQQLEDRVPKALATGEEQSLRYRFSLAKDGGYYLHLLPPVGLFREDQRDSNWAYRISDWRHRLNFFVLAQDIPLIKELFDETT